MIQESKGIFCIVFLFPKALYLWLCILAISTVPPTALWPLSLCIQREKYALTVHGSMGWKPQVKHLWAYSHVSQFNSIKLPGMGNTDACTIILCKIWNDRGFKTALWSRELQYYLESADVLAKNMNRPSSNWLQSTANTVSGAGLPFLVYFYCVILILAASVHCHCKRKKS